MERIDFDCPECGRENNLVLMGHDKAKFEKDCRNCKSNLEIQKFGDEISVNVRKLQEPQEHLEKVPLDYKIFSGEKPNRKIARFIAILILTASIMGIFTGYILIDFFGNEYDDYNDIQVEIVVRNNTNEMKGVEIVIDHIVVESTYDGNGTYYVAIKPGKHIIEVNAESHKNTTMQVFIPPQDENLTLIDVDDGIEGVNRFTFEIEEGSGQVTLENSTYIKMETWCPNLIFLFSAVGIWGAWMTYNLKSYNNAQIGAFFSVLAMGFFVVGPILRIIALYYLKRHKKMFTASFKN